jgi:hypothetical protein
MKKFIVETATETVLNIVLVDPNNLPVLPSGQEYRDEAGGKGQHWNGTEWVYPTERLELKERDRRNNKLVKYVDPIASNALRWAGLSSTEQAEWSTYRQALLDVPQQVGFPHTVTWPTKPVQ